MTTIPFQRLIIPESDIPTLRQQIDMVSVELATADEATRLRQLGTLGEWHYLLGEFAGAFSLLESAIALAAHRSDARALAANRLRLATALQYANRHPEAVQMFVHGLTELTRSDAETYRDFFLQHYGKCLAEMGDYAQARVAFTEALTLRVARAMLH